MVVLRSFLDQEDDADRRIEALCVHGPKVRLGIEDKPIDPGEESPRERFFRTTIDTSQCRRHSGEFIPVKSLELNKDAGRRATARRIQYVGRNGAHGWAEASGPKRVLVTICPRPLSSSSPSRKISRPRR